MEGDKLKKIIELVLDEIINGGYNTMNGEWDLINDYQMNSKNAINIVFNNIKDNI